MNEPNSMSGTPTKLFSIESQTVAFLEWARRQRKPVAQWLKWDGISVCLRYA